jgi:hypothetical protein
MVLGRKTGECKICKKKGRTEWHHIISQNHAKKTGQPHLISDPNNVIELCRKCHNQTTASMVRKRLIREEGKKTIENRSIIERKRREEALAKRKAKNKLELERRKVSLVKEERRRTERKVQNDERIIRKKQRKEERARLANEYEERKVNSINQLKERSVFIENPPSHKKRDFVRYLKQNLDNDKSVKNWFDFFHNNYRRIKLCKLYPTDHWLHNPIEFDKKLSQDYERDGFMWTETGFTWHKPVNKKPQEDEIYQEAIKIINLVTKEFTKAKRDFKKEINGVLNYLLIGK